MFYQKKDTVNKTASQTITTNPADFDPSGLLTSSRHLAGRFFSGAGKTGLLVITCTSVIAVLLIFFFVLREAVGFFAEFGFAGFLTDTAWYPEAAEPKFGALALIAGTLYVTVTAVVLAVPVGLMAAVFLSDIVPHKVRDIVKPVIEILAAIPSVAYGFFAVLVLAPWMQKHLGFDTGTNALNASIILAVMALPTIISVSEDSISSIGRELREASYGLGSTRMEALFKVVLPAAHSGIIAGVVLGMMRAVGETMVVWMASGNAAQVPSPWWDLSQSVRTMTATIAGDMGETVKGSYHYRALFGIGALLLAVTFILNSFTEVLLVRSKKKLGK